ncbi:MAG: SusC/RagA family TonB-linked outer membrane protein [Gemmatimonadota bacterium]
MFFDWLERSGRAVGLGAAVLVAWLFIGAGSAIAQQGAVAGTVTDAESFKPVAGAQVFIMGTDIGTLTGENGTYRLTGVQAGQVQVVLRLIGYRSATKTVTVQPGQTTTVDFQAAQTALRLQELVVTGVVGETPRVKLPFTVERLDPEDLPVPSADVSTLLHAKAPGVSVVQGSGQPGTAANIMLRGPTSINASGRTQGPLIVIDGVIQAEGATLADINSLDVENIEIVKGAAAASLYGSRAQNGVIQITTKRGQNQRPNTFDVMARNEVGFSDLEHEFEVSSHHPYRMNAAGTAFLTDAGIETPNFSDLSRAEFGNQLLDNEFDPSSPGNTFNSFSDNVFPTKLHDHVKEFFSPGTTFSNYVAGTGRLQETSFRISFENYREQGVISCDQCPGAVSRFNANRVSQGLNPLNPAIPEDDGYRRRNARLNVDSRLSDLLDVSVSGFYSNSIQDDAAVDSGAFFGLTFMSPGVDLTKLDEDGLPRVDIDALSQEQNPLYDLATTNNKDKRQRIMGSADLTFSPVEWFRLEGNASYDRTDFNNLNTRPKNQKTHQGGGVVGFTGGSLSKNNFFEQAINASITASVNKAFLGGDLTTRSKIRYLVEDQNFESTGVSGQKFVVGGTPNFGAIDQTTLGAGNSTREINSQGYFFITSLDYKGKYIVDGLARRDGSSLFGPDERWHWYFRGSAAWRLTQEDWFNIGAISELKFRYSYGTAGGRPNFFAQFETFGISAGQVFPINLGNRALKPEFSTEQEAGVNLVLFDKVGLDVTYAWSTTDDQLLLVPQPGFVGFSSQWQNAGQINSQTIEGSLRYAAIDKQDVGLNFRLNLDHTNQEIDRLDIPDFTQGRRFFTAEGEELGAIWGHKWATGCGELAPVGVSDCSQFQVNDDGYLVFVGQGNSYQDGISKGLWGTSGTVDGQSFNWGLPIKVFDKSRACLRKNAAEDCALTDFLPLGSTTPDLNASFSTNFRYKGLTVSTLLDATVGLDIYNGTEQWAWRDGSHRGKDIDQFGKAEGLKKPLAYYSVLYDTNDGNAQFVQNGKFLKVRELSVGYSLPQRTLQSIFGGALDRVSINVIGRNLFTFTPYTGYDPEVATFNGGNSSFGSASLSRDDAFTYPNFRTVTASVEIVF